MKTKERASTGRLVRPVAWTLLMLGMVATTQAQYSYTTNNGTITIARYTGPGGVVAIPDSLAGMPVVSIGDSAFAYCCNVTNVAFPNSLTNIGSAAFLGCRNLASAIIPDTVTRIGPQAFYACDQLAQVVIGKGVAFFPPETFVKCPMLTAIIVDDGNPNFTSLDGVVLDKAQTTLIECPGGKAGSFCIPETVRNIGPGAFSYCSLLTDVSIPEGVTNIPVRAFSYSGVNSVRIPNGVTAIEDVAFSDCWGLTNVLIPDSVVSLGESAFLECTQLTNVDLPKGIRAIRDWTFSSCPLVRVVIPDGVTNIGYRAFAYSRCVSVTIPASVTSIGGEAFGFGSGPVVVSFLGDAPSFDPQAFGGRTMDLAVCHLPGTFGWGPVFAGAQTMLWNPSLAVEGPADGVSTNGFKFAITGATNLVVVIESSTGLGLADWIPVGTNNLNGGHSIFSDLESTNNPSRFYRVRSP